MATTKWEGLWAQERQAFYAGKVIKRDEARAIINGTVSDVEYGIHDPYDILPEDFV